MKRNTPEIFFYIITRNMFQECRIFFKKFVRGSRDEHVAIRTLYMLVHEQQILINIIQKRILTHFCKIDWKSQTLNISGHYRELSMLLQMSVCMSGYIRYQLLVSSISGIVSLSICFPYSSIIFQENKTFGMKHYLSNV
jgi:hypothetical protein